MRYTREVRWRLTGPISECAKYISQARTILGAAWERDSTIGGLDVIHDRVRLADGVEIAVWVHQDGIPIIEINLFPEGLPAPPETTYELRLAWKPEGIVLTPTTDAERDGWGLPTRESDVTGAILTHEGSEYPQTAEGAMPQVILNRYENNKYLDNIKFVSGLPDGLPEISEEAPAELYANNLLATSYDEQSAAGEYTYRSWIMLPKPWSFATPDDLTGEYPEGQFYDGPAYWAENSDTLTPGIYKVVRGGTGVSYELLGEQFDQLFAELITEEKAADDPESGDPTWFCHRPEELLYSEPVLEFCHQNTNGYRTAVGEAPCHRIVRGDCDSSYVASMIISLSDGHFFHSHPDFLPGYRTTGGRVFNATGREPYSAYGDNVRENIAAVTIPDGAGDPEAVAEFIIDLWRNSPPHYANMVDDMWTEFTLPFNSWGGGTKLAAHHIGISAGSDFYDRSDNRDSSVTIPINPPALGAGLWAQIFVSRESWVPCYDTINETVHGVTGVINGTNPYSHSNLTTSRQVGWNKMLYEYPAALVPPQFVEDDDDFLCTAGSAVIEVDGELWVRAVYYKTDTVTDIADGVGGTYPTEGDYIRMYVVRFPLRIADTSKMPWRPDTDGEYEVEWQHEWLLADGWLTHPPGKVIFNSTGTKFCFTMHKIGATYNEALDFIARDWTNDRSALDFPRAAIQCVHCEWSDTMLDTLADLYEYAPSPLTASVTCYTGDPAMDYTDWEYTRHYERTLQGLYDMFPFYDDEDNLTYLTLSVDEYSISRGNFAASPHDSFPSKAAYCWRVRKLIFPSGKEITYMQQYMEEQLTTTFVTDPPEHPNYKPWPGTGSENFYTVIHYLDPKEEDICYSKIQTDKEHWTYNATPYYRINGDVDYIMDLGPEPEIGQQSERIIENLYNIPKDNSPGTPQLALNAENNSPLDFYWDFPDTRWIYNMDVTPCTFFLVVDDDLGAPPGLTYADTVGTTIPDVETVMAFGFGATYPTSSPDGMYERTEYRGNPAVHLDAPWAKQPFEDYEVSAYTGYQYFGDNNNWTFGTAKKALSFMNCNIAPNFSKWGESQVKVIKYDDRIIVRWGINHVHKVGYIPPAGLRSEGTGFSWAEWEYYAPPEEAEVLLWANFDIDEAVGISDVRDVWPMGKIV